MSKQFTIIETKSLPQSECVITGSISVEAIQNERKSALKSFQDRLTIDGFRKGHIPEKILLEKLGEMAIYEEAASRALEKAYPEIIAESKINPIGNPRISITKISVGSPVEFKIESATMPELKLSDYKNIAKEINQDSKGSIENISIEDNEVDESLNEMRRSFAHFERHHKNADGQNSHDHHHDDHSGKDIPEEELPALDDEFAKKIGKFESLDVLKEKIKEGIRSEKTIRAREKNRLTIIEKIIDGSEIPVPNILIEGELSKMIAELRSNIERMGVSYDEYLKNINKNESDFRNEWRGEAEKRSKIQLVLNEIAKTEKIEAEKEILEKEVEGILNHHKDAKRSNVEIYVENMLINEKVWQFLEAQN
jgi:trigger factor